MSLSKAMVQYSFPPAGVSITKDLTPPVKVSDLDAWFKAACKTIPQIPAKWYRHDHTVTRDTILFELINSQTHEKCAVIIKRR